MSTINGNGNGQAQLPVEINEIITRLATSQASEAHLT